MFLITTETEIARDQHWQAAAYRVQQASSALSADCSKGAVDTYVEAERALLAAPAPTGSALGWKLRLVLPIANEIPAEEWDAIVEPLLADIERLLTAA